MRRRAHPEAMGRAVGFFFFFASIYVYLRYADVIPGPEKPSEYFSLPTERERVYALAITLFDVGQLRLRAGVPRDLMQLIESHPPIPGLC